MNKNIKSFSLNLEAQKAKMSGTLAPVLGQYSINIMKFCKEFNDKSTIYEIGFPLKVIVFVLPNNEFSIHIKGSTLTFLVKKYMITNLIKISDIYKILLIKKIEYSNVPDNIILKNIISVIFSLNVNIQYE